MKIITPVSIRLIAVPCVIKLISIARFWIWKYFSMFYKEMKIVISGGYQIVKL